MTKKSIGVATMETNGDIVLQLRAPMGDTGTIGEGYFRYRPGADGYDDVLRHLGGMQPGESKSVPPWPDD
jgi:hypothetical protein